MKCVEQERGKEFSVGHVQLKESMGQLSEDLQGAAGETGL